MGLLIRPMEGPAGQTKLDGPVLSILSLGQFTYSKIDLSVFTLLQLPSPTKALFSIKGGGWVGPDPEWKILLIFLFKPSLTP